MSEKPLKNSNKVMVEAKTDEICKQYVEQVVSVIVKNGHTV